MIPSVLGDVFRRVKNTSTILSMMGTYAVREEIKSNRIKDAAARRRHLIEATARDSRVALRRMNISVDAVGYNAKMMSERNFLLVGNHMSYMDILVECTIQPSVFVTSVDMGHVPVLGKLAALGGSVFVERRHRGQVDQDLKAMSDVLREGFNVMIFPEGTSTDGKQILPFKKSLLMSAVEAGVDILPVCLKYTEINGEPFSPANADTICWYGDMTFTPHFLKLMTIKSLKAEVHFLEPIPVSKDSTRNELAEKAYLAIHKCYFGFAPERMPADQSRAKPSAKH
jgi:1-acyl-sn-glycerol-3-phosphate acyltransferase